MTCGHEKSAMDTLVHRFTLILTSCTHCLHAETAALIHVVRLLVGKVTKASADFKIFANLICTYFQNLSNLSNGLQSEYIRHPYFKAGICRMGQGKHRLPSRAYTPEFCTSTFSLQTVYFQSTDSPSLPLISSHLWKSGFYLSHFFTFSRQQVTNLVGHTCPPLGHTCPPKPANARP